VNSAARLVELYTKVIGYAPSSAKGSDLILHAWATVFDVPVNGKHVEDDVTLLVTTLREEIELVRHMLEANGVPSDLYSVALDRLRDYAAPSKLRLPHTQRVGNLNQSDIRLALGWSAWALRGADENEPDAKETEELQNSLTELESIVGSVDLPPRLRGFSMRQIETLRRALRLAGIQGGRPMREAIIKVAGEYATGQAVIEAELVEATQEGKQAFGKVARVLEKAAKYSDTFSKFKKAGQDLGEMAALAAPYVTPYVQLLLGRG
jgi:hypothetical protein